MLTRSNFICIFLEKNTTFCNFWWYFTKKGYWYLLIQTNSETSRKKDLPDRWRNTVCAMLLTRKKSRRFDDEMLRFVDPKQLYGCMSSWRNNKMHNVQEIQCVRCCRREKNHDASMIRCWDLLIRNNFMVVWAHGTLTRCITLKKYSMCDEYSVCDAVDKKIMKQLRWWDAEKCHRK